MKNVYAGQSRIEKTHSGVDHESATSVVNVVIILLIIFALILSIFIIYERRKHLSFSSTKMMNPYGSGYQRITKETRCYYDRTVAEIYYKDENGIMVGHEIFDRDGFRKEGWKYENGTYHEWVLHDENNPQKGGKWVEKNPPPDRIISNLKSL